MVRLLRVVAGLTLIFMLSQMVVIAGAKAAQRQDGDLFAPYVEIMPGKLDTDLSQWCASYIQQYPGSATHICQLKPSDGDFASGVVYVEQGIINNIGFSVNNLEVGDLAKRWGHPRIESMGSQGYNLHWNSGEYEIVVPLRGVSHFSYWLPVDFLSVSRSQ